MKTKKRVVIAGIGGVGGYYGGMLAGHYANSESAEIIFVARGSHMEAMKTKGLLLKTPEGERTVFPDLITDKPEDIDAIDVLVICVKSYDLERAVKPFASGTGPGTLVLPLLNGVNVSSELEKILPKTQILKSCVYIVSRVQEPGVVVEKGRSNQIFFGSEKVSPTAMAGLESFLRTSGINVSYIENIDKKIWEKFLFVSPIAAVTSAFNKPVGFILQDSKLRGMLVDLMRETFVLGLKMNMPLESDTPERVLAKIEALPYETYSSMHSDFMQGKSTELDTFTGFTLKSCRELQINCPVHEAVYALLSKPVSG